MRIAIIGGGIIGCSIAYSLGLKGMDVLVIDRNGSVGHGSTSASSAIVRCFYSVPEMISLAHEGSRIWSDWRAFIGDIDDDLIRFERTGMLFIPPDIDESVTSIVAAMQAQGIRAEVLSANSMRQKFPFLNVHSLHPPRRVDDEQFLEESGSIIHGAVFEQDAGYIVSPLLAAQNFRLAAEREGVKFRLNTHVARIEPKESGGFNLEIAGGETLQCDCLVNAAGPYSASINSLAGVELPLSTRPMRQEVHQLANPMQGIDGHMVPAIADIESGYYARPDRSGAYLLVGSSEPDCDELEWIDDPDSFDANISQLWWDRQSLRLMKRFPRVERGPAAGLAALYDVSVADWYPIADRTDLPGYYVCIGTSGSSFKTSPVLGQLMARMIEYEAEGNNQDESPVRFTLGRIGRDINSGFLSRNRKPLTSSGTVMG